MAQVQAVVVNDILPFSAIAVATVADGADRFVKFQASPAGSSNRLGVAVAGVADEPDGIGAEAPVAGETQRVNTVGRLRIELGGTVSAFDEVGPDALGRAIAYPAGTGYAKVLAAGVVSNVVDCIWLDRRRMNLPVEANDDADVLGTYAYLHKVTISAGADTATLGAGRYVGQKKIIQAVVAGGGTYAIAGAFLTSATATTSATFNAVGDRLVLMWDGAAWFVLENTSVTLA